MAATDVNRPHRMEAFKPSPALAPYVTDIWLWELPRGTDAAEPGGLTLLPDGHPTFCFVYGDALKATHGEESWVMRSALCGFQARPMQMACDGFAAGVTVRFVPWGLACFMPGSMDAAAHVRLDCRDVFSPSAIEDLESALFELPSALARVRRVESFLLERLRPDDADRLVQCVIQAIVGSAGPQAISRLAVDSGASERTLERRFRRAIGVAPKSFVRVLRLQEALRLQGQRLSWAESAVDAGYYDQAHLIRDAREIFGVTPNSLAAPATNEVAQGFDALARKIALPATIFR